MTDEGAFADRPPSIPDADEPTAKTALAHAEEAGAESFPASDPPAVWIWEVKDEGHLESPTPRARPDRP